LPNIKSAKKRVELTQDRAQKNNILKTTLKTALKKFDSSLESGNKEEINNAYKAAVSTVDKVASKGVIKKNAANNKKSALGKKLNSIEK
jgi:small subunit ribosomal protein S20